MSVFSRVGQFWRARVVGSDRVLAELNSVVAELNAMEQRSEQRASQNLSALNQNLSALNALADRIVNLERYTMSAQNEIRLGFDRSRWRDGFSVNEKGASLYLDLLESALTGQLQRDGALSSVGDQVHDPIRRSLGRDWPVTAETMIGTVRMRNLRNLLERALEHGIQGDFIETGVWRGGACIYARAILDAHGENERKVFVADSFKGLPSPDAKTYPADEGDQHYKFAELAISRDQVASNFERFGLLSENVIFLEGWFKDTLPEAPIDKLCVLRLDGDLYESTIVALNALYHKVEPGGFVIVDDYLLPNCAKAVADFRVAKGIVAPLHDVDGAAVWWQVPGT